MSPSPIPTFPNDFKGTELILVRHGETQWNLAGRMQGHGDSPLTEAGRTQARGIASRLDQEGLTCLVSSDLGRAMETAAIIGERVGFSPATDQGLRERNMGCFQGLDFDGIRREFPEENARFRSRDPDFRIPGGESANDFLNRVKPCLEAIASRNKGGRVGVVTHGGVLDVVMRIILGIPLNVPRAFSIFNTALNSIVIDGTLWRLNTWGDVCHLRAGGLNPTQPFPRGL